MSRNFDLQLRTKRFALRVMKLVAALPSNVQGRAIANQLMQSGTSVAANYRAVCRARSRKDFIAKLGIVIEEADESLLWMELIVDSELLKKELVEPLLNESNEILKVMLTSRKTAIRANKRIMDSGDKTDA